MRLGLLLATAPRAGTARKIQVDDDRPIRVGPVTGGSRWWSGSGDARSDAGDQDGHPLAHAAALTALLTLGAAAAGWSGLGWLVTNVPPSRPLAVLAAYVFAFAGLTSTLALLAWVVQLRPGRDDRERRVRTPAGYLAHSMLFTVIVLFGVWLQTLRTLTPLAVALLLGLYVSMELALLFGTRGSVELPVRR